MSDSAEMRRLEQSRVVSRARVQQFVDALPDDLNAWDDRIDAEIAMENAALRSKLAKVYRLVDAAADFAAPYVACKRGCSACCRMNVSITALEAERLSAASGRPMAQVIAPVSHVETEFSGTPCPFLLNDECSICEVRPFAWRCSD